MIKYKNDKTTYLGWIVESISKTYKKKKKEKKKKKKTDEEKERKNKALY